MVFDLLNGCSWLVYLISSGITLFMLAVFFFTHDGVNVLLKTLGTPNGVIGAVVIGAMLFGTLFALVYSSLVVRRRRVAPMMPLQSWQNAPVVRQPGQPAMPPPPPGGRWSNSRGIDQHVTPPRGFPTPRFEPPIPPDATLAHPRPAQTVIAQRPPTPPPASPLPPPRKIDPYDPPVPSGATQATTRIWFTGEPELGNVSDTRPFKRELELPHDTRPMQPVNVSPTPDPLPVPTPPPLFDTEPFPRSYDKLFPPPQPGDEDYFEHDHTPTELLYRDEPIDFGGEVPPAIAKTAMAEDSTDIDLPAAEDPPATPPDELPE